MAFFEQEALIFARFLPDFLLPGPLCYCPTLDAVITCNSALEVVCYKYQTLAAAQAAVDKVEGQAKSIWTTRRLSLPAVVLGSVNRQSSINLSIAVGGARARWGGPC